MNPQELTPLTIASINDGAILEAFEIEIRKALDNIADINTIATATRAVTIKLILKPHSDRVTIDTEVQCAAKLATIEPHVSRLYIGRDQDGSPVAFSTDPRQLPLWQKPKPTVAEPLEFKSGQ